MRSSRFIITLLLAIAPGWVVADNLNQPYSSSNRNPFVQIYGLPAAQSAQLTSVDQQQFGLQWELSNNFTKSSVANEAIFIDGESNRINLQWRYGLRQRWEVGVDLPLLSHDSGSLDQFIEDWHDIWGLPDGDRPAYPRDKLRYSYQRDSQLLTDVDGSANGIGDLSFNAAYQLAESADRQWALRSALKLPTGDADKLLGSESTDLSLALHVSDQSLLQDYQLSFHVSAGLLWMDGGEVMTELREDIVVYGSSTLSWQFSNSVSLKVQLDGHSAFYDSSLTELGDDSAQLIIGGAIRLSPRWVLDLAVIEDVAVNTAPDVVFHIGLKAAQF
ncbi:MAG: hypothetical protein ACJAYG_001295 [Oceanicoccus sp.]|jgi:hypothetical protein